MGRDQASWRPVLSAALFGLAVGALAAGRSPGKLGRKRVLLGVGDGVRCGLPGLGVYSGDLQHLTVLRFITGVGLGAANAVTLTSEYCPVWRAMLANAMFCGFPLGAAFGGFLAAWMIPPLRLAQRAAAGRRGAADLLVGLAVLLPESVRYMVIKGWPADRIRRVCSCASWAEAGGISLRAARRGTGRRTSTGWASCCRRGPTCWAR